jgi:hypothetical protein
MRPAVEGFQLASFDLQYIVGDEIVGSHFSVFYPPEAVAAGKPQRELREAALHARVEEEGGRIRDGTRFRANVVNTALRDRSGELVGFAGITRDLTGQREAEGHRHTPITPPLRGREAERGASTGARTGHRGC